MSAGVVVSGYNHDDDPASLSAKKGLTYIYHFICYYEACCFAQEASLE